MAMDLSATYASLKCYKKESLNLYDSRDLTVCIGFLGTYDSDVSTITVTIIKNGVKQKAMEPSLFSKTIGKLETWLYDIQENHDENFDHLLFVSTARILPKSWYPTLSAHRVFFVPRRLMWETIGSLLTVSHLEELERLGIHVTSFVDTEENVMTLKL